MYSPDHPTIKWYEENPAQGEPSLEKLEPTVLQKICLDLGADDIGFVEIDRPALTSQKADLLELMPEVKTIVSLAFRLNRQNLRTTVHSVANLEFRQIWTKANNTAHRITAKLESMGIRALNVPAGFPFETERWPGKMWFTSDKLLAIEAGLGQMGWNRLVLHPRFGAFTVLGTLLLDVELTSYNAPLDYNPCIECKLCVAVCPTGAVGSDGYFTFPSCYTHNYRERLGGFINWVETVVQAQSAIDYREKVTDSETISMWQNLSIGAQTKCDRCVAACPAGKEVIGKFLQDRPGYTKRTVKRYREKLETIYVLKGSDAEAHVKEHFPNKTLKYVGNGTRPSSVQAFLFALPRVFQRNRSEGLNATFHFTFTGSESIRATVIIHNKTIEVHPSHVGAPDFSLNADSKTWLEFLRGEKNLMWALLTRKIKVKGPISLMKAFAACFPS
jgi:epoxyqueuosine reductase QueG/putative sterol carrier protein